MFDDIHIHNSGGSRHTTTTVHEHRAPTDDSVKLLNELTEKALANLVSSFATTNNTLQATWAHYKEARTGVNKFLCKFVLNGKSHQIQVDIGLESEDTIVEKLYQSICNKLAIEMMAPILKEMKGARKWTAKTTT